MEILGMFCVLLVPSLLASGATGSILWWLFLKEGSKGYRHSRQLAKSDRVLLCKELLQALPVAQEKRITDLHEEIRRLRQEREWITVIGNFVGSFESTQTRWSAEFLYNPTTRAFRASPTNRKFYRCDSLCAPGFNLSELMVRYERIQGKDRSALFFGTEYTRGN